ESRLYSLRIMRLTLLLFFVIAFVSCNRSDQLQKYTYYLFAVKENARAASLKVAACFFYKKHGQLFLVTNWHVISDMDPISGEPDANPVRDTVYIRIKSKTTGEWYPCQINLQQVQKNLHWRRADILPDVFACKIQLPEDAAVSSIEELVPSTPNQMENDKEIFMFGYPDGKQFESPINYYNSYKSVKSYGAVVKYTGADIQWGPG